MKTYKVCLCRTVDYTATVRVEAESVEQANLKACIRYEDGDYDDYLEPVNEWFEISNIEEDK